MYICTFLGVRMQHLNIPNKIRTSKNVHMTSFSHLVSLEKQTYLVKTTDSFHLFLLLIYFILVYSSHILLLFVKLYIFLFIQKITRRKNNFFLTKNIGLSIYFCKIIFKKQRLKQKFIDNLVL